MMGGLTFGLFNCYYDIVKFRLRNLNHRNYIYTKLDMRSNILIALTLLMTSVPFCNARNMTDIALDSAVNDQKIIYFGKGEEPERDSTLLMIRRFYEDQFRHTQDPMAPYFMFMSKDNNLAMGVGGCVRMRAYYDWAGSVPSPAFAPYLIPMQKDPAKRRYLGTTPAGTALFFRVLGTNRKLGNYELYIEANFNGYEARDFHLKKAYGVINDFTIGYANSTFSDPTALPPAVDAAGPNAKMSATAVLVRWLHNFRKRWSVAISVESPYQHVAADAHETEDVNQYVPDFAAFGQYEWGSGHVRLAGIARNLIYRDLVARKNRTVIGWGLQLSGLWKPEDHITLYGMFNGGRGYSSLGGDWLMGKYDLVGNPYQSGRMYAPGAIGGYGAVQYNLNPSMFFSATYGATRYLPHHDGNPDEYKTGMYIAVNYFWYLTSRISCAAEFNLGRRENMNGQHAWARRAGIMAQFSF